MALIGAGSPFEDPGSVYVVQRVDSEWKCRTELTSDIERVALFGWSVSVSGEYAFIGSPRLVTGVVFVFQLIDDRWVRVSELVPPDAKGGDDFGWSVFAEPERIIIGAWQHEGNAECSGMLEREAKVSAKTSMREDRFGFAVAIHGNVAVIGAPYGDVDGYADAGCIYVFQRAGRDWIEEARLTAPQVTAGELFGHSVGVSGKTIVVGAPGTRHHAADDNPTGAAYIFRCVEGAWTESMLVSETSACLDRFGASVAIDGDVVLVGMSSLRNQGRVSVFERRDSKRQDDNDEKWIHTDTLAVPGAPVRQRFGSSVSLSGKRAIVGTLASRTNGGAYLFERQGQEWVLERALGPEVR
jgi:hypothetical protein